MSDFNPISVKLVTPTQVERVKAIVENLPVGQGIECVFRKEQKIRKPSANSLMWAGPLKDIADQAWVSGRQFSAEVWHEHFKKEFLPEDSDPEIHLLAKEGYKKWDFDPKGNRVLVGSTTNLLKKGFALYLQQVEAFGAGLGVMFHASPDRY